MGAGGTTSKHRLCQVCWPGGDAVSEFALVTVRGPWGDHEFVVCDRRLAFQCSKEGGEAVHGHCVCEDPNREAISRIGSEWRSNYYDGVFHRFDDLALLDHQIGASIDELVRHIRATKSADNLNPAQEIVWAAGFYFGTIDQLQFAWPIAKYNRGAAIGYQGELCTELGQWRQVRRSIVSNVDGVVYRGDPEVYAFALRVLLEYIDNRTLYRILGYPGNMGPLYRSPKLTDPLLVGPISGSWAGGIGISVNDGLTGEPITLGRSCWADVAGAITNAWGSLHRDLVDGSQNSLPGYYANTQHPARMTHDLHQVLDGGLHLSGSMSRAVVGLFDLHDQSSRYKLSENYWLARALSHGSDLRLDRPAVSPLPDRYRALYRACTVTPTTPTDVISTLLTLRSPKFSPIPCHHQPGKGEGEGDAVVAEKLIRASAYPQGVALVWQGLVATLGPGGNPLIVLRKLCPIINQLINSQILAKAASEQGDFAAIRDHCAQFRRAKMAAWAAELTHDLIPGAVYVITYCHLHWFLSTLENVDHGLTQLTANRFSLPA